VEKVQAYPKEEIKMELMALSEEQKRLMREMLQGEAWRIALAHLEELSIRKEREKAGNLRVHSYDLANRNQGIVDGIDYTIDTIERLGLKDKSKEEGPLY